MFLHRPGKRRITETEPLELAIFCFMEITGSVHVLLDQKGNTVWSVPPDATVFEAIQFMSNKNIGAVAVTKDEKLLGMLSERDYTRKVVLAGRSSRETRVEEIMTSPAITAVPEDSIVNCMRRMTERKVRHLPVVKGDQVVGVISIGDLVNWTINAQAAAIEQLENYVTGGIYQ
jgi:CBS domain-containing protein